ncbi:unnamed protein product [Effrenium voratum]|nr:unnamed protein product [Effrenium voratum]
MGDSVKWVVDQEVDFDEEVWKLEWYQAGSQLLVTCGTKEYRAVLLKQQLGGKWDLIAGAYRCETQAMTAGRQSRFGQWAGAMSCW